ncbi:HAD hydrolase family protein [Streptomyces sp. AJS327]|uniref:HAD hydrolase family protein n=1 Tax=Streptomyces sp. AJS327 TaxID=2545265 RepID=UPI0015DEFD15|nr:HAD hydrolase family protein [Streptomyces sp. AJS327]
MVPPGGVARPRLIATDLDGTLLRDDHTVSPRTLAALAAAEVAGIEVFFVTGRPPRWMDVVSRHVHEHGLAICGNGAALVDLRGGGRVVELRPLGEPEALTVVHALRAAMPGVTFAVERVSGIRYEPGYPPFFADPAHVFTPVEQLLATETTATHPGGTLPGAAAPSTPALAETDARSGPAATPLRDAAPREAVSDDAATGAVPDVEADAVLEAAADGGGAAAERAARGPVPAEGSVHLHGAGYDGVLKLLAYHPELEPDEFLELARQVAGAHAEFTRSSEMSFLEISGRGVSKASTLADCCAERGIRPEEVVAFGDMPNDLAMLSWAGTSYAMANAHPLVRRSTTHQAASNQEDGVAQVIESLLPR